MKSARRILLIGMTFQVSLAFLSVPNVDAQVPIVRLKVSKKSKSDYKTTYRSTDGRYRHREGVKSISYNVEVMNVSGGPPRDLKIKWSILVEGQSYTSYDSDGQFQRSNPLRVVSGESTTTLEFGKTHSFDTDVIELEGSETTSYGSHQKWGAKVLGYVVEVFVNDQLVASDIQPSSVKAKIDQVLGETDQKRHRF